MGLVIFMTTVACEASADSDQATQNIQPDLRSETLFTKATRKVQFLFVVFPRWKFVICICRYSERHI